MTIQEPAHSMSATVRTADIPLRARMDGGRAADKTSLMKKDERSIDGGEASTAATESRTTPTMSAFDILAYQRDVLERSILFFDTLRKCANAMLEHEQAGLPALLNFSEMILELSAPRSSAAMVAKNADRPRQ